MRVELLSPDVATPSTPPPADPGAFARTLDALGGQLREATQSEDRYAAGSGTLQQAMYSRAQADVALAVATAAAQRAAQAVQSILNMQI